MNIIELLLRQAKDQLTPKIFSGFRIREIKKESSLKNKASMQDSVVGEEISLKEFSLRYGNLAMSGYVILFFMTLALINVIVAPFIMAKIISALSILILMIMYFKTAFRCWLARQIVSKWEDRKNPAKYSINDFIGACKKNPSSLVLKKLNAPCK